MPHNLGYEDTFHKIARMNKTQLRAVLEALVKDENVPYESLMDAIAKTGIR